MKVNHDLHVHTYLSACCGEKERQRPGASVLLAEEMGLGTIGFSDHVWMNPDVPPSEWYRGQDGSQVTRLRADLSGVRTGLRVLVGCEADMTAPGKFSVTREFAGTLDYVLLACSHFHMKEFVAQPASYEPRDFARHMLAFFESGVESGLATSIAHPFLPIGHLDRFDGAVAAMSDAELVDAFSGAAERGVAVEVTVGYIPSPPEKNFSIETPIRLISLAKRAGCKFTFGSDAHTPEAQRRLPELMRFVQAVGMTEEDLACVAR